MRDNFLSYELFFALLPPFAPIKLTFSKIKKTLQDVIILQMFTINDKKNLSVALHICKAIYHIYMALQIWSATDKFFLSFWTVFCPFTILTTRKNENFKKLKREPLEISSFYTSVTKIMIICYTVP